MESFAEIWNYPLFSLNTGGEVTVSQVVLGVLLVVGVATGYLAGTIGVGGFVGVPAILGFLWKVEDEMAREFAICFYDRLFGDADDDLLIINK